METSALSQKQPDVAAQKADKKTTLNSDYETFLKMLTVQMRNQDPLNPVDSAEFALQLATFSSLEQQVLTNNLLNDLVTGLGAGSLQSLAGVLGKEVLAPEKLRLDGTPIQLSLDIPPGADRAFLVVADADGKPIRRDKLDPTQTEVTWAGTTDDSEALPAGTYSFRVDSYTGDDLISSDPAFGYAAVIEARKDADGNVLLVLDSGAEVDAATVRGLRS